MNKAVRFLVFLALHCAAMAASFAALAESYPSKPIRMIVPSPAGSLSDRVGRLLTIYLGQSFGQPIVVENRAGANGTLAMETCARAVPNGYTVCTTDGNIMTLNPYAYAKLPYDPHELVLWTSLRTP
jgi:tripartite-type tricarboxylate transporter receptor subunit TctC